MDVFLRFFGINGSIEEQEIFIGTRVGLFLAQRYCQPSECKILTSYFQHIFSIYPIFFTWMYHEIRLRNLARFGFSASARVEKLVFI